MSPSHNVNNDGNQGVADTNKSSNNVSSFFNTLKKGLRAAAAAKVCPNDREAIIRMVAED